MEVLCDRCKNSSKSYYLMEVKHSEMTGEKQLCEECFRNDEVLSKVEFKVLLHE